MRHILEKSVQLQWVHWLVEGVSLLIGPSKLYSVAIWVILNYFGDFYRLTGIDCCLGEYHNLIHWSATKLSLLRYFKVYLIFKFEGVVLFLKYNSLLGVSENERLV